MHYHDYCSSYNGDVVTSYDDAGVHQYWTVKNKLQWILNLISIKENAFENNVRKMSAIFSGANVLIK